MKIIISRKGFDGSNGGIPSPIMPDGTMLSMPIPDDTGINKYSDLQYIGMSYQDILHDLNPKKQYFLCHTDPDIDASKYYHQPVGWKPAFGQIGSSQSYLRNTADIHVDDLFLFFGNFHFVELSQGKLQYVRYDKDFYHSHDIQAFWGYLQIGKIVNDPDEISTYIWHPHSRKESLSKQTNTLYLPKDKLTFLPDLPGCGCFSFSEKRVLTMEGAIKGTWKENTVYMPESIIGNRKNMAKGAGVFYSGIWQELALRESAEAEEWAKSLF